MRRLPVISYVSLLLVLASGPPAMADPSGSVSMELEFTRLTNVGVYTANLVQSSSNANVLDSLGHSSWSYMVAPVTHTAASADIGTASGHAETTGLGVSAESVATPRPLADWSWSGWSVSDQQLYFEAVAAGPVRFDFDLSYSFDLETSLNGEKVLGRLVAYWRLHSSTWDKSGDGSWGWGWGPAFASPLIARDGADLHGSGYKIPCFLEVPDFAPGEGLYLDIGAMTYVSAVPVPSAMVLGMLGFGAASLRLRKHT